MCKIIILAALVAVSGQTLAFPQLLPLLVDGEIDPYASEQTVIDVIELILGAIKDPLIVDNLEVTLPDDLPFGLAGNFSVSELVASGIKKHNISGAGIFPEEGMAIKFTVRFDDLSLKTKYTANISSVIGQTFGGEGDIDIDLKGVTVSVSVQADLDSGIQLKNLAIRITLEHGSKVDVTGAVIIGEEQKGTLHLLTDDVVDCLDANVENISFIISSVIQDIVNSLLPHSTSTSTS